jgi:hypothetical protein
MNYIIPNGFDFYGELQKNIEAPKQNDRETSVAMDIEKCLITGEELDESVIELECGHKFNYMAILQDLISYKSHHNKIGYSYSDNLNLKEHEIRCPYCRQIQENLLPYLPDIESQKYKGVNYPLPLCMGKNECSYVFKSGKNKGCQCGKRCFRLMCPQHYKKGHNSLISDNMQIEMTIEALSKITLPDLRVLAKSKGAKKYSKLKKNDLIKMLVSM